MNLYSAMTFYKSSLIQFNTQLSVKFIQNIFNILIFQFHFSQYKKIKSLNKNKDIRIGKMNEQKKS